MSDETMSLRKMKIFHDKWRQAHEEWTQGINRMKQEQQEARRMVRHIEDILQRHFDDMEDLLDSIDQHEQTMEDHEDYYKHVEDEPGTRTMVTMRDHMGQVQLHDKHRQDFLKIQQKHQKLYKLLKRLDDSIEK